MHSFTVRSKTTLAVAAGATAGIALLACKVGPRLFLNHFNSSHKPPWNMTIKIASNESQCVSLVNELKRDVELHKVLGFDCEWVQIDNKRNKVALLQLATQEGQCGLFQIHFYSYVPTPLRDLLEDQNILKVGVAPYEDAKFLCDDYGINVVGTFDIRHLVDPAPGREIVGGLAAVVNSELGVQLPKNLSVRISNWEAEELTTEQQEYAANDALSSIHAFKKLVDKKVKVPFFCSKTDQWQKIWDYCFPLMDVLFREKRRPPLLNVAENRTSQCLEREKSGQPNGSSPNLLNKRSYHAFCSRKSPLYENAFMHAPDGALLCTCDTKKANWYVSKGLASVIEKEPLKIQLTFEPSGRVTGPSAKYYTLEKQNQCVVCGRKDIYVRKKIVPHEYRRYFPDCMKKHQSHDVLLLCAPCHARSNISDLNLRIELSQICNAPMSSDENVKGFEDNKKKALRSAARALMNKTNILPEERRKELINFIRETCEMDLTPSLMNSLLDIDVMIPNEGYTPHGFLVVKHFAEDGILGLMKLEKLWREHFVNVMKPKFLPPLWSVDHYHEREPEFSFDGEFCKRIGLQL